jgi:hypothetical protein
VVRRTWQLLKTTFPKLPIPQAGPTDEGQFNLVWDKQRHHFELFIDADGSIEWFYADRATDSLDGGVLRHPSDRLPRKVAGYLRKTI